MLFCRSVSGDKDRTDVEKQLRIVEQEASTLRTRVRSLESENEKLSAENKQLSISKLSKKSSQVRTDPRSKTAFLEKQLKMAGIFSFGFLLVGLPTDQLFAD